MLTRSALRRLVLSGSVAAAGLALFLEGTEACGTQQCNPTTTFFTAGQLVDDNTWVSNALDDDWLKYGSEEYLNLQIPALANRTFLSAEVDISPVENPNLPVQGGANNWTVASGNLVEFETVGTQPYLLPDGGPTGNYFFGLTVHNDTCATYWARIILHMDPVTPTEDAGAADATDAAADDDAGDAIPD